MTILLTTIKTLFIRKVFQNKTGRSIFRPIRKQVRSTSREYSRSPVLYLLYIKDILNLECNTIPIFADDVILAIGTNYEDANRILQESIDQINT